MSDVESQSAFDRDNLSTQQRINRQFDRTDPRRSEHPIAELWDDSEETEEEDQDEA